MIGLVQISMSLSRLLLILPASERLEAARQFNSSAATEKWFIFVSVCALVLLTAAFLVITYRQRKLSKSISGRAFTEYANKCGLSNRERNLLHQISANSRLGRPESIFTISNFRNSI